MRQIHVEDDLRLRFPGRDDEFNEGVEIGLLLAAMASGRTEFSLQIAATTLDQARDVAARMGYRVSVDRVNTAWAEITCRTGRIRPRLTLVRSGNSITAYAPAG